MVQAHDDNSRFCFFFCDRLEIVAPRRNIDRDKTVSGRVRERVRVMAEENAKFDSDRFARQRISKVVAVADWFAFFERSGKWRHV